MVINEEEMNAFTQSVMGDSEGGGGGDGSAVYIEFNTDNATLDATFNELLEYYNNGKLIFTKTLEENDGTTNYLWYVLTQLQRNSYGSSITYIALFTFVLFYDGGPHLQTLLLVATDPDEKMMSD